MTDSHLMWAWHSITHPNPPSHCFRASLSLCLSVSVSLRLCVPVSLCVSVALCLCVFVPVCLCVCASLPVPLWACACVPCMPPGRPCVALGVPVCPWVPVYPWVPVVPVCPCRPTVSHCAPPPTVPHCASVLVYPLWLCAHWDVCIHCDHCVYSVHPVLVGNYEVSTPGQDRTGDLQRVGLTSYLLGHWSACWTIGHADKNKCCVPPIYLHTTSACP